ncbi:uncharacterized protein [Battus philenor]|uniref:uncharacterized protein n=1 Tax=Battus philenor TaxID=42288 RepID=UPI0035CFD934
MLMKLCLYLLAGSCLLFETYASSAPFINPCVPGDTECFIQGNARIALSYLSRGIPELGIESIDPIILRNITMDQGYYKLIFPDVKIVGGKSCNFEDVSLNLLQSTMSITMSCPLEATGTYKFAGSFCFIGYNHEGGYLIKTDSIRTTITSKIDTIFGNDGNRYFKLTAFDYFYEPMENLHVDLGGLFVGDLAKAQPFINTVNSEWLQTIAKIVKPLTDAAVGRFHDVLSSLFLRLPIEQLSK